MKVKVTTTGFKQVDAKFSRLIRSSPAIARAAVSAGLSVLAAAAKEAAIGTIKQEIGKYVRPTSSGAWGRAGLMQYPHRGDGQNGPHGIFVDQGTRYIQPRQFIGRALSAAAPRAIQAAKNAGFRTAKKISESKQ